MIGCVSAWWGLVSLGLVRQGRHGRASCGSSGCGVLCHRRFGRVRFRLVWLGWAGTVWQVQESHGEVGSGMERFGTAGKVRFVELWRVRLWSGKVCLGQAGMAGHGKSGHGTVWSGSERQARFGWQGKVRFGSAWLGRIGLLCLG